MELNTRSFFHDLNASKFVVYFCLLLFTVLIALNGDDSISCSYWILFLPLWIWDLIGISGGIVGIVVHCKHPQNRSDANSEREYHSMVLGFIEMLLLTVFELAICHKLHSGAYYMWSMAFVPLFTECIFASGVCIWAVKRDRNFEFELFFAVNILQFVFLALKLDDLIRWSWVVIFVPLWILICISLIGVLYAVVLAILFIRSLDLLPEHRRQHVYTAIGYTFLVVPILIFLVLLTNKLDGESELPYLIVCTPLYVSLLCLLFMACGTRGGNQWWFGVQKDFCHFLLDSCPVLRLYGNNSYKFSSVSNSSIDEADGNLPSTLTAVPTVSAARASQRQVVADFRFNQKPVYPIVSIEAPD